MAADMVVFDPITVQDRATFNSPNLVSKGILHVLVSGKFVLKNKKITRNRTGIFLNRVKQRTEGQIVNEIKNITNSITINNYHPSRVF